MSPKEATAIIRRIHKGEEGCWRPEHFNDMLEERGYSIADVRKLLRSGTIEGIPRPDGGHGNYRVRLVGRCLDGRETRLKVKVPFPVRDVVFDPDDRLLLRRAQ